MSPPVWTLHRACIDRRQGILRRPLTSSVTPAKGQLVEFIDSSLNTREPVYRVARITDVEEQPSDSDRRFLITFTYKENPEE